MEKMAESGYALRVNETGGVTLEARGPGARASLASREVVNDGRKTTLSAVTPRLSFRNVARACVAFTCSLATVIKGIFGRNSPNPRQNVAFSAYIKSARGHYDGRSPPLALVGPDGHFTSRRTRRRSR